MMKPENTNPPKTPPHTIPPGQKPPATAGSLLTGTGSLVIEHQPQVTPTDSTVTKVIGADKPAASFKPSAQPTSASVIDKDMVFEGTATFQPTAQPLIVYGRVEGNINGTPAVTIAADGEVNGCIAQPTELIIEGIYKGDATADQVMIGEEAKTAGTISYKKIVMLGGDNEIQLKPIRTTPNANE